MLAGSLLLAAAGLLKGYKATSHWLTRRARGRRSGTGRATLRRRPQSRDRRGRHRRDRLLALTWSRSRAGPTYAKGVQMFMEYDPQPPFSSGSPTSPDAEPAMVGMLTAMHESFAPRCESAIREALLGTCPLTLPAAPLIAHMSLLNCSTPVLTRTFSPFPAVSEPLERKPVKFALTSVLISSLAVGALTACSTSPPRRKRKHHGDRVAPAHNEVPVVGMGCRGCAKEIGALLRHQPGVMDAEVWFEHAEAYVVATEANGTTHEQIAKAIDDEMKHHAQCAAEGKSPAK